MCDRRRSQEADSDNDASRQVGASSCLAHPLVCAPAQSLREVIPGGRAAIRREQSCAECRLARVRLLLHCGVSLSLTPHRELHRTCIGHVEAVSVQTEDIASRPDISQTRSAML